MTHESDWGMKLYDRIYYLPMAIRFWIKALFGPR